MDGTTISTLEAGRTDQVTSDFDLVAYARKYRYRLRNLHDGGPVPPAIWKAPPGHRSAYAGPEDRCDAIVGFDGYIADEGEPGQLGICLFYGSAKGVNKARAKLKAMGGKVTQEGDTEIAGTIPIEAIKEALALIKVSKVANRNPRGNPESIHPRFQSTYSRQNRLDE
jgi:hypothetical protein